MKHQLCWWAALLILGMVPGPEAGEIYQWTDKEGVQHFTDGPPPPGAQIVEGLSEGQPEQPTVNSGAADDESPGPVEGQEPGAAEIEVPDAVEDGGNVPTSREDYWRRRGWESGPTEGEAAGTVESGENAPLEGEGLPEGGESRPID